MSSMFGAGFGFLFTLPILIAQWVGVIGFAKSGRNGPWWCMAIGTGLSTLVTILTVLSITLMALGVNSGSSFEFVAIGFAVLTGMTGLGSLLFMVGFAIHGLRSKRMIERIGELESVLEAQGEQLSRQDPGSGS